MKNAIRNLVVKGGVVLICASLLNVTPVNINSAAAGIGHRVIKRLLTVAALECILEWDACKESVRDYIRDRLDIDEHSCVPAELIEMMRGVIENGRYSEEERAKFLGRLDALKRSRVCNDSASQLLPDPPPAAPAVPQSVKPLVICQTHRRLGTDRLMVRVGPHRALPVVTRIIPPAYGIKIIDIGQDGWVKIQLADGITGWIKGAFLKCDD